MLLLFWRQTPLRFYTIDYRIVTKEELPVGALSRNVADSAFPPSLLSDRLAVYCSLGTVEVKAMEASPQYIRSGKYALPARNIFDVVAAHDITSFLTLVRGVNPFDHSPGMKAILEKAKGRPVSANPFVITTDELDVDVADIAVVRDAVGNTVLHLAAGCGHVDMVSILLEECGADVNARNHLGFTSLQCAARNGHLECSRVLLEYGADVSVLPVTASAEGHPAVDQQASDAQRTSLFLAHYHGHSQTALAVAPYLSEVVARLPKASMPPEAARRSLTALVRGEDTIAFALLFDVLDCESAGCGPLSCVPPLPPMATLRRCVLRNEALLGCLLPTTSTSLSPALLFIFDGMAKRGLLGSLKVGVVTTADGWGTLTGDVAPILLHALRYGHVKAVHLLTRYGLTLPTDGTLSLALESNLNATPESFSNPQQTSSTLAVDLLELRRRYTLAMESYRHKPESKQRKRDAWEAKVALREKEMEAEQAGVTALLP